MWYIYIHIHTHNGILLSHETAQNNVICGNMDDIEIITLSEVSQTEKSQISYITYMRNLKHRSRIYLFTKQKQNHRHRKQTYGYYQRG